MLVDIAMPDIIAVREWEFLCLCRASDKREDGPLREERWLRKCEAVVLVGGTNATACTCLHEL